MPSRIHCSLFVISSPIHSSLSKRATCFIGQLQVERAAENPTRQMEQNNNQNQPQTTSGHSPFTEPICCIVKLGGAAITCKNELEMINEEILQKVSEQLRQAMIASSEKSPGMDCSKRPGSSEICCDPEEFGDHTVVDCSRFIVVHGAGSFGHFQASKSGVHKGQLNKPLVKGGFVATRISLAPGS